MREFIIFAGPQAAGKTTVIKNINNQFRSQNRPVKGARRQVLFPLQESRQIIVHKNMLLGGIFMTIDDENEIVHCDWGRMDTILHRSRDNLIYTDECNVFTIAHALAHGVTDIKQYWDGYIERLEKLHAKIVFLDIPPEVTWGRRQQSYRDRLVYFPRNKHADIMRRYRECIDKMYPLLVNLYAQLPLPKEIVDANKAEDVAMSSIYTALARLSTTFQSSRVTT